MKAPVDPSFDAEKFVRALRELADRVESGRMQYLRGTATISMEPDQMIMAFDTSPSFSVRFSADMVFCYK